MFNTQIFQGGKEGGQGLVEYSFILILVAIGTIATLVFLGQSIRDTYCHIMVGLAPLTEPPENCGYFVVRPKVNYRGPNNLNLEAEINDPDADPDHPFERVERVDFYIDTLGSSPVQSEYHYRYCLSGNIDGQPCHNFDTSGLPPGEHLITIEVQFIDGSTSSTTYKYTK
jgi:hypothetical protein